MPCAIQIKWKQHGRTCKVILQITRGASTALTYCHVAPCCQPQNIISVCVADHGSGAACSPSPPVARLVDLTPAAFLALGRPLSDGLAKVLAYVGSGTCDW